MQNSKDAVRYIKACQPNTGKFIERLRGFVDWKFGEVAEYLGYDRALAYVESMRRWHDFPVKYSDCQLNTSFVAFLEAEQELNQPCPVG